MESNILEVVYTGNISIQELLHFGEQIAQDTSLPDILSILTDATNAQYTFNENEIKLVANAFKKNIARFKQVQGAFVYGKPLELAYSILHQQEQALDNYHHRIFSTREAALNWLKAFTYKK